MRETFLLRMPEDMKRWFENEAKGRGLTLTGLILAILSEYRNQTERRGK